MARFDKSVIAPGDYETPDGPASVPPERIDHWISQHKAMREVGLEIPVSWGHLSVALPSDPTALTPDEQAYRKSRYNAGWMDALRVDPATGELWASGDTPALSVDEKTGALIDPELKTAIREVSLGVGDFRDGKGRLWKDAIIHLALTPHPVWGGQGGFRAASDEGVSTMYRFGLSGLVQRFALAADEGGGGGGGGGEKKPEKKDGEGGGDGGMLKKILKCLKDIGKPLPDDTTDENFMDRLYTMLTAMKASEGGDTGATAAAGTGVTEEQPTYMGGHVDPSVRILFEEVDREKRAKRTERINALVGRGCPPHVVRDLQTRASRTFFSLDPTTKKAAVPAIDRELDLLEKVLPAATAVTLFGQISPLPGTTAVPPPNDPQDQAAKSREAADSMARAAGLPARKSA